MWWLLRLRYARGLDDETTVHGLADEEPFTLQSSATNELDACILLCAAGVTYENDAFQDPGWYANPPAPPARKV